MTGLESLFDQLKRQVLRGKPDAGLVATLMLLDAAETTRILNG